MAWELGPTRTVAEMTPFIAALKMDAD